MIRKKALLTLASVLISGAIGSVAIGQTLTVAETIPDDKSVIQFETKIGVVTFLHQMHANLDITECTTCHHKLQPEDSAVTPCHECHKKESKKPAKAKTAFHTRCTGCHQYTVDDGGSAGPVRKKCKLCHIKPATE